MKAHFFFLRRYENIEAGCTRALRSTSLPRAVCWGRNEELVHARLFFSASFVTRAEIRNSAPEITAGLIIDPGHVFAPLFRHSATRWSVRLNLRLFTG